VNGSPISSILPWYLPPSAENTCITPSCIEAANLGVLAGHRDKRPLLIEERQRMVEEVKKLRLDVVTGLCLLQHPASGLVGVPTGPGGANHDGDAGFRGHDNFIF
jgi:hypothetical protein